MSDTPTPPSPDQPPTPQPDATPDDGKTWAETRHEQSYGHDNDNNNTTDEGAPES